MNEFILVFITCPSKEKALEIKDMLLKERLAGCINLISDISSFFWWQKKLDFAREVLLLIKTHKRLFKELCEKVKKLHEYSVPEIIAVPISLRLTRLFRMVKGKFKVIKIWNIGESQK